MIRICNPVPNHSATHAHKSGTLARTRTENNNTPFERAAFTNLATRALLGGEYRIRTYAPISR